MTRVCALLAALALVGTLATVASAEEATTAEATISDPLDAVQVNRLANGLTVLTLEDHSTPVVSM